MSELREVPPKTPVIDLVERIPKVGKPVGKLLRVLRAPFLARRRAKQQEYIDRTYHDKLRHGQPEREDNP